MEQMRREKEETFEQFCSKISINGEFVGFFFNLYAHFYFYTSFLLKIIIII